MFSTNFPALKPKSELTFRYPLFQSRVEADTHTILSVARGNENNSKFGQGELKYKESRALRCSSCAHQSCKKMQSLLTSVNSALVIF